jgi:hypothetical protein
MVWLAITLLKIAPSTHIAAEVSSHDDSIPNITGTTKLFKGTKLLKKYSK